MVPAVEALITKLTPADGTAIYYLPAGTELIPKPLIDASAEIRLSSHHCLADFGDPEPVSAKEASCPRALLKGELDILAE
jgi:hypothetical protein